MQNGFSPPHFTRHRISKCHCEVVRPKPRSLHPGGGDCFDLRSRSDMNQAIFLGVEQFHWNDTGNENGVQKRSFCDQNSKAALLDSGMSIFLGDQKCKNFG